jgi:hypothetical protein
LDDFHHLGLRAVDEILGILVQKQNVAGHLGVSFVPAPASVPPLSSQGRLAGAKIDSAPKKNRAMAQGQAFP